MIKRALIVAGAVAFCAAAPAFAQSSSSSKYDWDSGKVSCMEPYAPVVPKADEVDLEELRKDVKPQIEAFIQDSNRYLECLSINIARAREEGDQQTLQKLIKAHNDNVKYQQSVAGEFNETLKALKEADVPTVGSLETPAKPGDAEAEGASAAEADAEAADNPATEDGEASAEAEDPEDG